MPSYIIRICYPTTYNLHIPNQLTNNWMDAVYLTGLDSGILSAQRGWYISEGMTWYLNAALASYSASLDWPTATVQCGVTYSIPLETKDTAFYTV